ncbi:sulfurtransferase [Rhodococcus rhodnii]|uniref:Rhodanese domain-containing protein n=2 Tax=Rhodococcus rhodnii TaxID=38312 RepID=R7WW45_9NOCA|nr:sulfurtransferase [Rhodococcus rhodnii]EOM78354.1 hypothetical protein Rrhod_0182 [Rhodococcus rhodnii LMG 5362]TXG91190.1 sulfurtransferase [Rhodococcus rhodnii]
MSAPITPPLVTVDWLRDHLDDADLVAVDASNHLVVPDDGPYTPESGRDAYLAEHIPGAVFADPLTAFADSDAPFPWTAPSHEQFAAAAGEIGIGDGARVVIYQDTPGPQMWSTRFWWQLRLEGFDDAVVLDGGLPAWKAEGLPVTDDETVPVPRTFSGVHRPELIRTTQQVLAELDDPGTVLVNVLDPATYRGESTNYARPGHIPGSINLPVSEIVDPDTGGLRSPDQLRTLFSDAGLLDPQRTPVAHALAIAGRDDVAVYDGSMTAWTADPDLPLVEGADPR